MLLFYWSQLPLLKISTTLFKSFLKGSFFKHLFIGRICLFLIDLHKFAVGTAWRLCFTFTFLLGPKFPNKTKFSKNHLIPCLSIYGSVHILKQDVQLMAWQQMSFSLTFSPDEWLQSRATHQFDGIEGGMSPCVLTQDTFWRTWWSNIPILNVLWNTSIVKDLTENSMRNGTRRVR